MNNLNLKSFSNAQIVEKIPELQSEVLRKTKSYTAQGTSVAKEDLKNAVALLNAFTREAIARELTELPFVAEELARAAKRPRERISGFVSGTLS